MECTHDFYGGGMANASAFASNSVRATGISQDNGRNRSFLLKWKPSPFGSHNFFPFNVCLLSAEHCSWCPLCGFRREKCLRSCQSHSSLVDPFNGKECIPGHLSTVDYQCVLHLCLAPECVLAITLWYECALNSWTFSILWRKEEIHFAETQLCRD